MYRKKGVPAEGDLVVCTVERVEDTGIFVDLDEYECKGVIRIDEVSTKRVKRIKEFAKPGQKLVCKVLSVNPYSKFVDLSLKRVNENQKKAKINEYKLEKIAIQVVESLSQKLNIPIEETHKILDILYDKYEKLYPFFQEVVLNGKELLREAGVPEQYIDPLFEAICQRIKPKIYIKEGELEITTLDKEGIRRIKEFLKKLIEFGVEIKYISAPKYYFKLEAKDPRELNKKYQEFLKLVEENKNGLNVKITEK